MRVGVEASIFWSLIALYHKPATGAHLAVLGAVDVPAAAHDIAFEHAVGRRPVFAWFAELIEVEGDEQI